MPTVNARRVPIDPGHSKSSWLDDAICNETAANRPNLQSEVRNPKLHHVDAVTISDGQFHAPALYDLQIRLLARQRSQQAATAAMPTTAIAGILGKNYHLPLFDRPRGTFLPRMH
jgi:hypothetical protein